MRQLVWADQQGNEVGTVGAPADYELQSARLSPNGNALLIARKQESLGTFDIFRLDLVRQTEERLTADRGSEVTPIWIDGERAIVFAADRGGGVPQLFRKDLATGAEQRLFPPGMQQLAMDVFPGGRAVAYLERSTRGGFDIFQLPLTSAASPAPLLVSRHDKYEMRLSPDGRAMAFVGSDGARTDLYVASVPITTAPVLAAANVWGPPRWSVDGRRLFYLGSERKMMSIAVRTTPVLDVRTPQPLFELKRSAILFDVARDGRFLLLVPQVPGGQRPIAVATFAIGPSSP